MVLLNHIKTWYACHETLEIGLALTPKLPMSFTSPWNDTMN